MISLLKMRIVGVVLQGGQIHGVALQNADILLSCELGSEDGDIVLQQLHSGDVPALLGQGDGIAAGAGAHLQDLLCRTYGS